MKINHWLISLILVTIAFSLFVFHNMESHSLAINMWSLQFVKGSSQLGDSLSEIPAPPDHHDWAYVWLAREHLTRGRIKEARAWMQVISNDDPFDYSVLGEIYLLEGKYLEAIEAWKIAKDINSLLEAANNFQSKGNLNLARDTYKAVFNINEEVGATYYANFLYDVYGNKNKAEEIIRLAINHYPNSNQMGQWLNTLGEFLNEKGDWGEAEEVWKEAIVRNPYDWRANLGLAWAYYRDGENFKKALSQLKKAIHIQPSVGAGYYDVARLYAKEGMYQQADIWFIKALEHNPQNRWWMLARANNLRDGGNIEKSLSIYNEIIEYYPDWSDPYHEAAWAYWINDNPEKSISMIEKTRSMEQPRKFWYFFRAGKIYMWLNRPEEALDYLQKALSVSPQNEEVKRTIKKIMERRE